MALQKVNENPGADKGQQFFDKYDAVIDFLQDGTSGQILTGTADGSDPVWSTITTFDETAFTFSAGWDSGGTSAENLMGATKNGNEVEISMVVNASTGGTTSAFTLPVALRPVKEKHFLAAGFSDGSPIPLVRIVITPAGLVSILLASTAAKPSNFDGLSATLRYNTTY
jgi:hypothetical protein